MQILRTKFFKVREPKRYNYTPRFYDERKEKLEKMINRYSDENKIEGDDEKERLRVQMRMRESINERRKNKEGTSAASLRTRNYRLLIILTGLVIVTLFAIRKMGLWDQFFN